ncbi:hypothetical protein CPC08DRAFT_211360 [Agrocybe pediades]|nr:hypothetical protein CPC08DRAFT_211360 [Agrocybe pediades]
MWPVYLTSAHHTPHTSHSKTRNKSSKMRSLEGEELEERDALVRIGIRISKLKFRLVKATRIRGKG